jgi:serine/threonine-protein kinase
MGNDPPLADGPMATDDDMRLVELARERGMIDPAQLEALRQEHTRLSAAGRPRSPLRVAIEQGVLSEEAVQELETEEWLRGLPPEIGGYRLVRQLGRGGMAVVFEGEDLTIGKRVAIKLVLPEFSKHETYLARFHREARIAARLSHPNTVQVFQAGESPGLSYLVMEYVEGEPLSAVIRREGRLPERRALEMIWDVAGAVEEASGLGIIHRDIKPGNILVSKWGTAKLADFGIAKELRDLPEPRLQQSLTLGVVGTPTYMSPEQARGARELDVRSDIYSLGATLYHMVVGELPFTAATPQETLVNVVALAPRLPRAANPDLSEQTAAVICKMMAKDPEDRYGDIEELREDLEAAARRKPVSIRYAEAKRLVTVDGRPPAEPASAAGRLGRVLLIAGAVAAAGLIALWVALK